MQQALPSNNFLSVNMLKPTPTLDPTLTPAPALAPTLSRASAPMAETEVAQAPALMPTAPHDDREAVGDEDGHDSHTGPADDHNDQEQSGLFAPPFVALHRIDPPHHHTGMDSVVALTRVADAQINVAELAVTESDSSLLASEERQQLLQDALPVAGMNSIATSQFHFDAPMPIPLPSTQHHRRTQLSAHCMTACSMVQCTATQSKIVAQCWFSAGITRAERISCTCWSSPTPIRPLTSRCQSFARSKLQARSIPGTQMIARQRYLVASPTYRFSTHARALTFAPLYSRYPILLSVSYVSPLRTPVK